MSCLKNKIGIQYNYDFHMHHQLVDASQMLGEFESFYCNRNVHSMFRYEKPYFLSAPYLKWYIDSQISEKGFLVVF